MAYKLDHFPEYAFIVIIVSGTVSLEENREIGSRLLAQLGEAERKTDVLFDLRALEQFPTSISQLRGSSAIIRDSRLGWIILLTPDKPLLKFVATVLLQLQTGSGRVRMLDTLEAAISFLQRLQPNAKERAGWLSQPRDSLS